MDHVASCLGCFGTIREQRGPSEAYTSCHASFHRERVVFIPTGRKFPLTGWLLNRNYCQQKGRENSKICFNIGVVRNWVRGNILAQLATICFICFCLERFSSESTEKHLLSHDHFCSDSWTTKNQTDSMIWKETPTMGIFQVPCCSSEPLIQHYDEWKCSVIQVPGTLNNQF